MAATLTQFYLCKGSQNQPPYHNGSNLFFIEPDVRWLHAAAHLNRKSCRVIVRRCKYEILRACKQPKRKPNWHKCPGKIRILHDYFLLCVVPRLASRGVTPCSFNMRLNNQAARMPVPAIVHTTAAPLGKSNHADSINPMA